MNTYDAKKSGLLNLKGRRFPVATITALELMQSNFLPREDLLENILPRVGSGLIVAPSFHNKSQFVLQLGLAVASPGENFIGIEPHHGPVLLAMMEHAQGEVQTRLKKLLPLGTKAKVGDIHLLFRDQLPQESEGGLDRLRALCRIHKPVFVAIDSFVAWRGTRKPTQDLFGADYESMDKLRRLGEEVGAFILLPHHSTRWARGGDGTRDAMGTGGLGAGASVMLKLDWKQGQAKGTLTVQGNEVPFSKVPITWDAESQRWGRGEQPATGRPDKAMQAAKDFLRGFLKGGPQLYSAVMKAIEERDVCSVKTLKKAKQALSITSQGHGKDTRWAMPPAGLKLKSRQEDKPQ